MNGEDFLEKINSIDDDLIEEAANLKKIKKSYRKIYAIASALTLILAGTLLYRTYFEGAKVIDKPNSGGITVSEDGRNSLVYVPKIELQADPGVLEDMIGLIVYKGRIYTQSFSAYEEETTELSSIVGKKLGYANGNISEWSKQSDYSKEFSSTVSGDVYTVNGYSEDFRICIKGSYKDEDGKIIEYIHFFENLNGIGLSTGEELFGDRLKLKGNWDKVKYAGHANWDNDARAEYKYLDLANISEADIEKFLNDLYSSEFVDLSKSDIYNETSHHLYVYMKDGTRVELRLSEGGYVGYQALGWYFIKMPGEIFDKIYEASK